MTKFQKGEWDLQFKKGTKILATLGGADGHPLDRYGVVLGRDFSQHAVLTYPLTRHKERGYFRVQFIGDFGYLGECHLHGREMRPLNAIELMALENNPEIADGRFKLGDHVRYFLSDGTKITGQIGQRYGDYWGVMLQHGSCGVPDHLLELDPDAILDTMANMAPSAAGPPGIT